MPILSTPHLGTTMSAFGQTWHIVQSHLRALLHSFTGMGETGPSEVLAGLFEPDPFATRDVDKH
jgi:hypothetical protein